MALGADDATLGEINAVGMENMTVVETIGLTKRYGSGVLAVDSVGMSVQCGEVYGADIAAEHGERAKLIVSP